MHGIVRCRAERFEFRRSQCRKTEENRRRAFCVFIRRLLLNQVFDFQYKVINTYLFVVTFLF